MGRPRHDRRDEKVIATVECPLCFVARGEPCRAPNGQILHTHQPRRQLWRDVRDGRIPTTGEDRDES